MTEQNEKFVDVPGGHLHRRIGGEGRDVVLLNPGAADLRTWDTVTPWLERIARVTTFDYRDTGLSSTATEPYSELDDIAAVLTDAGVRDAVLVGVSDGARRALAFAHRHPERVSHVVAVAGSFGEFPDPTPEEEASRRVMREHFARLEKVHAADGLQARAEGDIDGWAPALDAHQRRRMVGLQLANTYWVLLEEYLGTELDPPVKHRFAELAVPVSVLVGERDFEATRLWARRLAAQVPDATLTVLPEADHFPMLSAPEAFERHLRGVLG
ncbi:alpha/beta fold hydrolase [Phytomonospora endophytica]|uniref:Pimeloyl-ACP methyl ester carboxylesterase n=1 Tax=Phytomonospora endophytica TaxID=714109 RepID=A0A841FJ34_9ACTN|nr:alpha/beta hydrolase [Phytomonospora endophytica]MBB6033562.1 pimeloyl-ACP methyl ester carboxylesterase [Phytomonospora endophytica]GIG64921.1 hypothetical protein Pen01_12160 [Phytomonospora endophytica]